MWVLPCDGGYYVGSKEMGPLLFILLLLSVSFYHLSVKAFGGGFATAPTPHGKFSATGLAWPRDTKVSFLFFSFLSLSFVNAIETRGS